MSTFREALASGAILGLGLASAGCTRDNHATTTSSSSPTAPPAPGPAATSTGTQASKAAPTELVVAKDGLVGLSPSSALEAGRIKRRFPNHDVWRKQVTFENAPDHGVPTVCIGPRRPPTSARLCAVQLFGDKEGVDSATVHDASVRVAGGIRVGMTYREVESQLHDCALHLGDDPAILCRVRDRASLAVELESDAIDKQTDASSPLSPRHTNGAKVRSITWNRTTTP